MNPPDDSPPSPESAENEEPDNEALDASVKLADATTNLVVQLLINLHTLETLPDEEWDQMEPPERTGVMDTVLHLRSGREMFLANLPIDLRREWEEKLGI